MFLLRLLRIVNYFLSLTIESFVHSFLRSFVTEHPSGTSTENTRKQLWAEGAHVPVGETGREPGHYKAAGTPLTGTGAGGLKMFDL